MDRSGPLGPDPCSRRLSAAAVRFRPFRRAAASQPRFLARFRSVLSRQPGIRVDHLPPAMAPAGRRLFRPAAQARQQHDPAGLPWRGLFLCLGAPQRTHHRRTIWRDQGRLDPVGADRQSRDARHGRDLRTAVPLAPPWPRRQSVRPVDDLRDRHLARRAGASQTPLHPATARSSGSSPRSISPASSSLSCLPR